MLGAALVQAGEEGEDFVQGADRGSAALIAEAEGTEAKVVLDRQGAEQLALFRDETEPGPNSGLDREPSEVGAPQT